MVQDKNGDMGFHPNGEKQLKPKLIMSNVSRIASGINHLVMLSKNKVYTMGCGDEGQLGRICQRHSNRESRVGKRIYIIKDIKIEIIKYCKFNFSSCRVTVESSTIEFPEKS